MSFVEGLRLPDLGSLANFFFAEVLVEIGIVDLVLPFNAGEGLGVGGVEIQFSRLEMWDPKISVRKTNNSFELSLSQKVVCLNQGTSQYKLLKSMSLLV